jgi:predicted RNase H-like HicB family nuclease
MPEKLRYTIVVEGGEPGSNYSAFVPDLPGCIATGQSLRELKKNLREAILLHLHGLREDGMKIPEPVTPSDYDVDRDPRYAGVEGDEFTYRVDWIEVPRDPQQWARGVVDMRRTQPTAARRA